MVIREGFHTGQFLINLSVSEENLKTSKSGKWDQLLEVLKQDELLKAKVTTFVITYNNGLADTIRNDKSETKTFRGDGYMYEKLIFKKEDQHISQDSGLTTQDEVSFRISPFSFFQTNTLGAQQLFSLGMQIAGQVEGNILDLYC
ncbi:MAG: hypothetical protein WCG98_09080 [bacterium]